MKVSKSSFIQWVVAEHGASLAAICDRMVGETAVVEDPASVVHDALNEALPREFDMATSSLYVRCVTD